MHRKHVVSMNALSLFTNLGTPKVSRYCPLECKGLHYSYLPSLVIICLSIFQLNYKLLQS